MPRQEEKEEKEEKEENKIPEADGECDKADKVDDTREEDQEQEENCWFRRQGNSKLLLPPGILNTSETEKPNVKAKPVLVARTFTTSLMSDGTVEVTCNDETGKPYVRSRSNHGWTVLYTPHGAKETETFQGADGKVWFTWYYVGEPTKERAIMKIYGEGDGVHPVGMVEWYHGERGSEEMYFKHTP